jgi:hypothetical protein
MDARVRHTILNEPPALREKVQFFDHNLAVHGNVMESRFLSDAPIQTTADVSGLLGYQVATGGFLDVRLSPVWPATRESGICPNVCGGKASGE